MGIKHRNKYAARMRSPFIWLNIRGMLSALVCAKAVKGQNARMDATMAFFMVQPSATSAVDHVKMQQ